MFYRKRRPVLDTESARELRELLDRFLTLVIKQRSELVILMQDVFGRDRATTLIVAYRMGFIDGVRAEYAVADAASLADVMKNIESDGSGNKASRKFFEALTEDISNDPIYASFFTGGHYAGLAFLKLTEGERSDARVNEIAEMLPRTIIEVVRQLDPTSD